jgi:CDP-diacylglycerol--serine O-phosphatidyltransferase
MNLLSFIPNTFTFLNLFFGCIGVIYGLNGDFKSLAMFVFIGMLCDFFDGFSARLLNVKSKFGAQLDSFSDLITFGFTSGIVMYILLSNTSIVDNSSPDSPYKLIPYFSFLITISASYRLASFNLNSDDSYFTGLPTPANALLVVFLPFLLENEIILKYAVLTNNVIFLLFTVILSSFLMNCNVKMFSLKIKNFTTRTIVFLIFFLILSILMYLIFNLAAFPLIIIIYILINLFGIKI